MYDDPPPCENCGHHRGAHFREGCDADLGGSCPCRRYAQWAGADFNRRNEESAKPTKVCIGCNQAQGANHLPWCPVVTGTLNSLPGGDD